MSWQPPPPPPKPGGGWPGGNRPDPNRQPGAQQQPPRDQPSHGHTATQAPPAAEEGPKELNLYQLLQVDKDAHVTIIRYAYRFLAAMYHPDNGETGDSEKFRIITEAWKTLSDDGKRAAYDMSLGLQEQQKGGATPKMAKSNEFGRESLPHIPKTGLTWNEIELRIAILQILLAARKKRPMSGGASMKMLMDVLHLDGNEGVITIEFACWYLREKGFLEQGERVFMITAKGLDYLTEQLSQTQILDGGSATEKKVNKAVKESSANLPARIVNQ
ncbi:MAG: J domain-containing protein [Terriglobales bacterium]